MNNRIFIQGLVTTVIGVMILIFCGLLMYEGKASPADLSGWLAAALLFLRSKDSLIGIKKNEDE